MVDCSACMEAFFTYLHLLLARSFSVEVSIHVAAELLAMFPQLLVNFYDLLHVTHAVSCPVMVSVFQTQRTTG